MGAELTVARVKPALKLPELAVALAAGWDSRLPVFIERRRHMAFAWGRHDCGLFAADAVREITGQDLAAELRGYKTALGAARALACYGLDDVAQVPAARGLRERAPIDARRGDVVSWRGRHGLSLGIVLGDRFAVPGLELLQFFPLDQAVKAWRIG